VVIPEGVSAQPVNKRRVTSIRAAGPADGLVAAAAAIDLGGKLVDSGPARTRSTLDWRGCRGIEHAGPPAVV